METSGLAGLDAGMVRTEVISKNYRFWVQLLLDLHEWLPDIPMKNELERGSGRERPGAHP